MAIGQYLVMMRGSPAGQHCPISSRYTLPSAVAFFDASMWTWAAAVNFGYGDPNRQASGLPVVSMNQLPVKSNGGLGRGLARLAGASALGWGTGSACVGRAAAGRGAVCADTGT